MSSPDTRFALASGKPSRWLILSYASNQDGMACAQHLDDRLPFLQRSGIEPVLITGICGERWPDRVQLRVPSLAPSGIRFEARYWVRRCLRYSWLVKPVRLVLTVVCLPFYLLEKLLINLESQWSWFILAAWGGLRLRRRFGPALLYSTGGSASAHVAAALVAKWSGIPWVAEFQDPLVYPGLARSRRSTRVYEWVERLVARRASTVLFLTEEARRRFNLRTGGTRNSQVIYPGANPSKMPASVYRKSSVCRFSHFGTLSGSRNLQTCLQALRRVLAKQPAWERCIELHLYGHMDGPMRELVREFPLLGLIIDHGRLPRQEILVHMAQADVLLLVQNVGPISAETIPSKLYEYAFTSRPILGLIDRNPELTSILTTHGHFVAELGDLGSLEDAISRLLSHWEQGFANWHPVSPFPFTVERAVRQLVEMASASSPTPAAAPVSG